MCDRIFMIFRGSKVLDGTLDEIQSRYGIDTVRVRSTAGPPSSTAAGRRAVSDHGQLQDLRLTGRSADALPRARRAHPGCHFEVTQPSLHDIFVRIARPTAEELAREAAHA